MDRLRFGVLSCCVAFSAPAATGATPDAVIWEVLEPGLELGVLQSATGPPAEAVTGHVLRIDPDRFELVLLNATARDRVPRTPRQWARSEDLVAAINASMFQEDLLTSVSLMRTKDHTNNGYRSKDKTVLAFDPRTAGTPEVKIIDRQCEDLDEWAPRYETLVQSIRMISCERRNVWRARADRSSVSAVAMDGSGKVLFIHAGEPVSAHDLIERLLALPLGISRAMYLEGGPQAQLYVGAGGRTVELSGSVNPLFGRVGALAWPVPNVIGVRRKTPVGEQ